MTIDFSKIPCDRPAAVHFQSLGQAIAFFIEISEQYPEKIGNWTEDIVARRYSDYRDFCLNPYMDEPGATMCYCDLDYYLDENYVIVEYDDLVKCIDDLPIEPSDMSIDFILGI